jgi:hypothetical protein
MHGIKIIAEGEYDSVEVFLLQELMSKCDGCTLYSSKAH